MFKYLAVTMLLYMALALAATLPDQGNSKISNYSKFPAHSGKIINGTRATIQTLPWQISLLNSEDDWISLKCDGSIIASNWVITAAHCIVYPNKTELPFIDSLSAGTSMYLNGSVHRIIKKIFHPEYVYQDSFGAALNDIALLKINDSFVFDTTIQPVKLDDRNVETLGGVTVIASGWGVTSMNDQIVSEYLKSVEMSIATKTECDETLWLHYNGTMRPEGQFCAKNSNHGIPCSGDSGGPLTQNNTLIGVASWILGDSCTEPGNHAIYSYVSHYRDWILKQISA